MLKKYDELTAEEQKKVALMYSDKDTVQMYLYNFDEHGNYHGRQYIPPVGSIVNEPTVKEKLPEKLIETQPVKKTIRKSKKK